MLREIAPTGRKSMQCASLFHQQIAIVHALRAAHIGLESSPGRPHLEERIARELERRPGPTDASFSSKRVAARSCGRHQS
jgi:hypothetical protein